MASWWDSIDTLRNMVGYLRWCTVAATILSAVAAASVVMVTNRIEELASLQRQPRRLSGQQQEAMLPILTSVPRVRPLDLEWSPAPEIARFGQDILSVLRRAGWPVSPSAVLEPSPAPGLVITTSTLDFDTAKLQEALTLAGYESAVVITPGFVDRFRLTVGSRP